MVGQYSMPIYSQYNQAQHSLDHNRSDYAALKHLSTLGEMSYEDKRYLVEHVFAGKDAEGHRYGVYLKIIGDVWHYDIKGIVSGLAGSLPMEKKEVLDILGIDVEEYGDQDDPLAIQRGKKKGSKTVTKLALHLQKQGRPFPWL